MIGIESDSPAGVCMLADHLDTALAVGEDMLALEMAPRADLDESDPKAAPELVDRFVQRLRQLELSLITRVLLARRRLAEIVPEDSLMRAAGGLFRAQTALLVDLVVSSEPAGAARLAGASDSFAYLRSRGVIPPEQAAPSPYESVTISENFRIGGVVALGALLDLISSQLDLLDSRFCLYTPSLDETATVPAASQADMFEASPSPDPAGEPEAALAAEGPTGTGLSATHEEQAPSLEAALALVRRRSAGDSSVAAAPVGASIVAAPANPDRANGSEQDGGETVLEAVKPPVPAVPPTRRRRQPRQGSLQDALGALGDNT